jgi:hypothetical protein
MLMKGAVVATTGALAVAVLATTLTAPAAMAASPGGARVPQGQVKFFVGSPPQGSLSQGLSLSARPKTQRLLLPAVQKIRDAAGGGGGGTKPKPRGPEDCMSCAD